MSTRRSPSPLFPRVGSTRLYAVIAVCVLSLTTLTVGAVASNLPGDGHVKIVAQFADAGAVIPGNDVKVDGVKVGSISGVEVVDGVAHLTLSINDSATPVFSDATAVVRPVSLLGERYVDVDRGTPTNDPIPDGGTIPLAQTDRSVDLDEVLNAVDDPTGTALAALITTLGDGMAGNGSNVAETLEVLRPALTETDQLVGLLDDQNALLNTLIEHMAPVTDALGGNGGVDLDALVENTNALLEATAGRVPELEATLRALPATMSTARTALQQIATLSGATTPALSALEPLTSNLVSFSEELQAFADAANPALASLEPVLVEGQSLIDAAGPVIRELRAAAPAAASDAEHLQPIAKELLGNIDHVLNFLRNWALTTNGHDGISHYFRAHVVAGTEDLLGVDLSGVGLGEGDAAASAAGNVPLGLDQTLQDTLAAVGGTVDQVTGGGAGASSISDLTDVQLRNACALLFGGCGS